MNGGREKNSLYKMIRLPEKLSQFDELVGRGFIEIMIESIKKRFWGKLSSIFHKVRCQIEMRDSWLKDL